MTLLPLGFAYVIDKSMSNFTNGVFKVPTQTMNEMTLPA